MDVDLTSFGPLHFARFPTAMAQREEAERPLAAGRASMSTSDAATASFNADASPDVPQVPASDPSLPSDLCPLAVCPLAPRLALSSLSVWSFCREALVAFRPGG